MLLSVVYQKYNFGANVGNWKKKEKGARFSPKLLFSILII